MAVVALPGKPARRIDILLCPAYNRWPTLLYYTGGTLFNRSVRRRAQEIGFHLCNHCIARADAHGNKIGDPIICKTEEELFELLRVPYMKPTERDW